MKTLNRASTLTIVITIAMLLLSSCRKKEPEPEPEPAPQDTEQSTAQDNNLAELIASDIEAMGGQASENSTLSTYRMSGGAQSKVLSLAPCATVSASNGTITVDFGSTGCLGADGRTRTGKLFFDYSASSPTSAVFYRHPGFSVNVSSQNYVVDGNQVNILNKTIKNTTPLTINPGMNPGTNLTWSITANISIIKANNTGTVTWSCNRTKALINTSDTTCYRGQSNPVNWTKAIIQLNGSASGVNAKNETFTATATNLVRDFNCSPDPQRPHRHPFISGTVNYVPGSRPARLINYGSGTCDLNATVTINNVVFNIIL